MISVNGGTGLANGIWYSLPDRELPVFPIHNYGNPWKDIGRD